MFCVFGRSRPLAKKRVQKLSESYFSVVSRVLRALKSLSQQDMQVIVSGFVDIEFKAMKPRKCSHEFSTPEFSKECYDLMKSDRFNFDELRLMKKAKKSKGVTHSKRTGKPLFEWVVLNG